MIDLTPLEVRKKKGDFRRVMRGYEPALVDDFLDIVADRLEQLVREHAALAERVGGLEKQVAEYRERERALTDALVTAQAMREEIRTRTSQEVDELKQRALQDADTRVQQARQEAELLLQRARQDAEAQLRRAEQEATSQLQRAEEESATLRGTAEAMRRREEELLEELRTRQYQLLGSYRGFLERELSELKVMVETMESEGGRATVGERAAASEPAPVAAAAPPAPPTPVPAAATAQPEPAAVSEAGPAAVPEPGPGAVAEPAPAAVAPAPEPPVERPVELVSAPEPSPPPQAPAPPAELDFGLDAVIADATDGLARVAAAEEAKERLGQVNPRLDDLPLLTDDPADQGGGARHASGARAAEEDDEAARLLENAERAGYRINLLDDEDAEGSELLLEESAPDDGSEGDWLSSMIGDEEK